MRPPRRERSRAHGPTIGVENVIHDRQAESGAAAEVEPAAAPDGRAPRTSGAMPGPVVLDGNGPVSRRCARMQRVRLKRRSGPHCRGGCPRTSVRSDRSKGAVASAGAALTKLSAEPSSVRARVLNSASTTGAIGVASEPAAPRTPHPGARQFALDMASHRLADRFDRICDFVMPQLAKLEGVACEGRQGSLQAVRQIGCAPAGAFELRVARVEQGVYLRDQRPNFERRVDPRACAVARSRWRRPRRAGPSEAAARGRAARRSPRREPARAGRGSERAPS